MSGNPVLRSADDISTESLKKSGEAFDGSSTYSTDGSVVAFINEAHMQCLSGGNSFVPDMSKPFTWAVEKDPFILKLKPVYTSGTVSLVNGSSVITFNSAPTISLQRYMLKIDGRPEWFKILSHSANSATATIDIGYTDDTLSGTTFICALFEYDINPTNGVLRIVEPMIVYRGQNNMGENDAKIYSSSEDAMLREHPLTKVRENTPCYFCIVKKDNGVFTVRFDSYVGSETKVEVKYISIPDALYLNIPRFQATVSIASPGVVTKVSHGLSNGNQIKLDSTGSLPTGLIQGVAYFVVNSTLNTFQVSATLNGSAINTSGTQSGNMFVTPQLTPSYPLLPVEHRIAIEYMVAYWICEDKGDDRMQKWFALAVSSLNAMVKSDNSERVQTAKSFGRLIPRRDQSSLTRKYITQESS